MNIFDQKDFTDADRSGFAVASGYLMGRIEIDRFPKPDMPERRQPPAPNARRRSIAHKIEGPAPWWVTRCTEMSATRFKDFWRY
jgi:hypothetical protein